MHFSPGRRIPRAEHAGIFSWRIPRAVMAQPLPLAGAVVPSVLLENCCTGTELVTSVEWERALPSSELSVRDLFSCVFTQGIFSAFRTFLLAAERSYHPSTGNVINGFARQLGMTGWDFPLLLNCTGCGLFKLIFPTNPDNCIFHLALLVSSCSHF